MSTLLNPYFGEFGGMYVPQILMPALRQLEEAFVSAQKDPAFQAEFTDLLKNYAGRPTALTKCRNLTEGTRTTLYLKREDLLHGGAHKTNQVLGQALLAKRMGKTEIIAETGAGQHGVASALASALLGLKCRIYMGAKDIERQSPNVFRMRLMGAEVIPVHSGSSTLKDACNEALRDWSGSYETAHYMLGTAAGPHPFPTIVREFQRMIGEETKAQILDKEGRLPDAVIACVGGGSNAIGMFADFIDETAVGLIGVEPAGHGIESGEHGAPLKHGRVGIYFGMKSPMMQTEEGQIEESYSISAGLDFPSVGPQHAYLNSIGRADYVSITDDEALDAFKELSRHEGIIPALESSHALAHALKMMRENPEKEQLLVVNLSGRGDKSARGNLMERYETLFAQLKARREGAFVPFVTLGDPNPEQSLKIIDTLIEAGADALELGIPFSDPLADGPTIQDATLRAFAAGVTPAQCFEMLTAIRQKHPTIPIGLLMYANLVFSPGIDEFYAACERAGVDSVLVADVPVEESAPFRQAALRHNIAPIFICPPNADDDLLRQIASYGRGYTYLLSRAGVTGAENRAALPLHHLIEKLAEYHAAPPLQGFGISAPEQVTAAIDAGAAGAISGSAIVKIIERNVNDPQAMLAELKAFAQSLKAATKVA